MENYGVDQQRVRIPEPHVDKFPCLQTFSGWNIRFKTEVCRCSNFPSEGKLWIKDVELYTSVDDLKLSRSIQGVTIRPEINSNDCGSLLCIIRRIRIEFRRRGN